MSFAEYNQEAEDHTSLLILIKSIGSHLTQKSFSKVFDRIVRLQTLKVANPPRVVCLRYKRNYSIENNAWGNFQAHRKVLGLISVGKCENQNDALELCRLHEDLKEQYEGTLLDSRLVLFGSCLVENENRSTKDREKKDDNLNVCDQSASDLKNGFTTSFKDPLNVNGSNGVSAENDQDDASDNRPSILTSTNDDEDDADDEKKNNRESLTAGSHVLNFCSEEDCPELEEDLQEFLSSIFWVLESKRLDRSNERLDHLTLITAPFERKDSNNSDIDSRIYRKRCHGRIKKHLGDLCLLSGVAGEATLHYRTSIEMLRSVNDLLWMAGAYEGLAIALYVDLQSRSINAAQTMARNPSFSLKPGFSRLKDVKLRPNLRNMTSSTVRNGLDLADNNSSSTGTTLPDDVLENYKEAVINYSKFREAGIIEMEASLKACRILIANQKNLEAADFLQNVVTINLELMEEEKIQRFITLSSLYSAINMPRKAAFYRRVAAMQCVAPMNPKPTWSQCYHLLIKALPGYQLTLDPKEMPLDFANGWSSVQMRVLHELVYTARRMGNAPIAIRHLSFLLHTMFGFLRDDECCELSSALKIYTNKCEATHISIVLDNGTILPPVPFVKFPTVRSFRLLKLLPHHRPVHFRNDEKAESPVVTIKSPFIYSPLMISVSKNDASNPELYYYVEGETSEIALQLFNPLPFELAVDILGLITEGVEIFCQPVNITLPPESGPVPIKLLITPHQSGQLTINGYSTQVMGVKSHCRLREISHLASGSYSTVVIRALPMLQLTTSLTKLESFSTMADGECVVASGSISLYAGQSSTFEVNLLNVGKLPIERVDVIFNSTLQQDIVKELISWNESSFNDDLPLEPGRQSFINFTVYGLSDFLSPSSVSRSENSESWKSLRSLMEGSDLSGSLTVELLVLIQYSGGYVASSDGSREFCRQCSVSLTIDIQPSLQISRWQVIPVQSVDNFILQLDFENVSTMDIFIDKENLLIASKQLSRVSYLLPRHDIYDDKALILSRNESLISSSSSSELNIERILNRYVCSCVSVQWTAPSTGISGQLLLNGLWWNKEECALLQKLPVALVITIDDSPLPTEGGALVKQCLSSLSVEVTMMNRSDFEMNDVVLSIIPRQYDGHMTLTDDLLVQNSMQYALPIGCTDTSVIKILPDENLFHSCSFLFPSSGVYHIYFTCEANVSSQTLRKTWTHFVKLELYNEASTDDV